MRTLDRYILRRYCEALAIAIIAFIAIFLVLDLFEKLDDFLDHDVPVFTIARYYLYRIPEILLLMLPVGMMLSCLFSLGALARNNEFVAVLAAGVSIRRTLLPVLGIALFTSFAALAFSEYIAPAAAERVKDIDNASIRPGRNRVARIKTDLNFLADGERLFRIGRLDTRAEVMRNVVVQRFDANRLIERIDAFEAVWIDGVFTYRDGIFRQFSSTGIVEAVEFDERPAPEIKETAQDFAKVQKSPRQMSYRELSIYIKKAKASGAEIRKEEVDLNMKLGFPFTNFLLVLLGAPLAVHLRRGGNAVGFSIALALCFIYYLAIRVGQSFGHNGVLSPLLSAWVGNMIFAVAGSFLFFRFTNK